ncbi:CocE/NonD family hydrolase [uncultured Croceitalea sp.]|uniref:CocE/NonD family hydrolase n=1 Tax=uncultured Croceitalea sp. TaxID=1798908 RepID=UPI003306557A
MRAFSLVFIILFILGCNFKEQGKKKNLGASSNEVYSFKDTLVSTRDGANISIIIARRKDMRVPKPVILQSTIYVRDKGRDLIALKESVDRGYVGVIAYARGKRYSDQEIWPYENDANDTYDVIDWVSKQIWCDGRVAMFGGSYNGFTQWAATKKMHPALKTIVPYVANRPGLGLPMENNVFINPNYEWSFYVGNNKYLDSITGNDRQRFRSMQNKWWESGAAYKTLDSIDGAYNKWFKRWISHPSFDTYWQKMAPYKEDFAMIDIPILSIDGYYNDSQNSGLYYLREHYKYNPSAEHYLIIGPYSHFGAQRNGAAVINGYKVDSDALIDTNEITYQWFDYILNDSVKPKKLKDKINYQVMGGNEWRGASSIEKMSNQRLKLFLTNTKLNDYLILSPREPLNKGFLHQTVDFNDRASSNNTNYYPDPIILDELDFTNGFCFVSEPFDQSVLVNGSFTGELKVNINKKDFDYGVTLYELTPEGWYFHLSYIVGRASYAHDASKRQLLKPNKIEKISFSNTHLVSKKLDIGSRLVIFLDVNKNPFSQLNYGTGKKVMEETIKDAEEPLVLKWYNDSFVEIPIWKD